MIDPLGLTTLGLVAGESVKYVLFAFSAFATLLHTAAEVFGGEKPGTGEPEPFWAYYARVFGFRSISDFTGELLFLGLAAALIGLAVGGYLYASAFLLGGLLGARVGDAWLSHLCLRVQFAGANPGLATSLLYFLEVLAVAIALAAQALPDVSALDFLAGAGAGYGAFTAFWFASYLFKR